MALRGSRSPSNFSDGEKEGEGRWERRGGTGRGSASGVARQAGILFQAGVPAILHYFLASAGCPLSAS